jgi:hypothetical protein
MLMAMRAAMVKAAAALADIVVTGTLAAVAEEDGSRRNSILSDVLEAYASQYTSAPPHRGCADDLLCCD